MCARTRDRTRDRLYKSARGHTSSCRRSVAEGNGKVRRRRSLNPLMRTRGVGESFLARESGNRSRHIAARGVIEINGHTRSNVALVAYKRERVAFPRRARYIRASLGARSLSRALLRAFFDARRSPRGFRRAPDPPLEEQARCIIVHSKLLRGARASAASVRSAAGGGPFYDPSRLPRQLRRTTV